MQKHKTYKWRGGWDLIVREGATDNVIFKPRYRGGEGVSMWVSGGDYSRQREWQAQRPWEGVG